MKTATHLALPAAVALHTMGAILVSLATWAVIANSASPAALNGGLWVLSYALAAIVGLLGVLGLALALRDRRANSGGRAAQTLASVALATALILSAVRTFIPLGVVDRAIGIEGYNAVLRTLSMAGVLLAATAVVAGKSAAVATPMERTGRRFPRHLATPLALACLALVLPLLDAVEIGQGAWLPLVFAVALAIAAVAGAVLDFRALVSLIGVLFSAASGRYASRAARSSVIATALVFVAAATFIPFQSAGAALVSVIATALLLLVALGSGLVAVLSSRPTLRLPEPAETSFTETDTGVDTVRNPYLQRHFRSRERSRLGAGRRLPAPYHGRHDFSPRRFRGHPREYPGRRTHHTRAEPARGGPAGAGAAGGRTARHGLTGLPRAGCPGPPHASGPPGPEGADVPDRGRSARRHRRTAGDRPR
ncbi:hypothetical protein [Citricoccus sp.]|uniref:hypothetical protein n=1 Tax=Citricoccus sp. TaxID=1978372 RepID=UPI0028BDFA72|nr:hypothetical protein [Citricoccus sp.]